LKTIRQYLNALFVTIDTLIPVLFRDILVGRQLASTPKPLVNSICALPKDLFRKIQSNK
jgi:hypothetical protein